MVCLVNFWRAPVSEPSQIRFGVFELDARTGELRKHGVRLKIQDQPFQVLQALLERPGELVTREELQTRIWANDTFVDFDKSLNRAINKVRDVLSDTAGSPRFVETAAGISFYRARGSCSAA